MEAACCPHRSLPSRIPSRPTASSSATRSHRLQPHLRRAAACSATESEAPAPSPDRAADPLPTNALPANGVPTPADSDYAIGKSGYWRLLSSPDPEHFTRAPSASDAAALRRKGHLKEQDNLIEYLRAMHATHAPREVMQKMDRWIAEHRAAPRRSRLRRMVPTVGHFFTPLNLTEAFDEYDAVFSLSRRQYVPPNFAELRHILNIAQVHASAESLKLITFDADGTLYADGAHMEQDNEMIGHIINLMRSNVYVAIVTAAGYPGQPDRFEERMAGLLQAFRDLRLPSDITDRFLMMGGECNYLLRVSRDPGHRLEFVPDNEWKTPEMLSWCEDEIQDVLDRAEDLLQHLAARLQVPVHVIRKPRAVGVVPQAPTIYEVLEDMAITVQTQLDARVPFCAFNGGNDVFVDIGNKSIGLDSLMRYLDAKPHQVLHVGDRFTASGNDSATRDCCSILWVANPEETGFFIKALLKDIRKLRWQPYIRRAAVA